MCDEQLHGTEHHDRAGLWILVPRLVKKKVHALHHRGVAVTAEKQQNSNQYKHFIITIITRPRTDTDSLVQNTFLVLDVAPGTSQRTPIGRATLRRTAIGGMTRTNAGNVSAGVSFRRQESGVLQRQAAGKLLQGGFYHTHTHTRFIGHPFHHR